MKFQRFLELSMTFLANHQPLLSGSDLLNTIITMMNEDEIKNVLKRLRQTMKDQIKFVIILYLFI